MKRHGYYCRSRRAGSSTRPRSCLSCAKAKTGCDTKLPQCSRCIGKGILCQYPENKPRATGPRARYSGEAPTQLGKIKPSSVTDFPGVDTRPEANNGGDKFLPGALVMPDLDFADLGVEYPDWDDLDIGCADFPKPQMNDPTFSPGSSSLAHALTTSTDQTIRVQQGLSAARISIPTVPSRTVRSLVQRPIMQTEARRVASLILHTLNSYPLMMLHHDTFPPFIHPSLVDHDTEHVHMEPLTNCISLMHMLKSGVQGTRKLFWKNVRLECERLYGEAR